MAVKKLSIKKKKGKLVIHKKGSKDEDQTETETGEETETQQPEKEIKTESNTEAEEVGAGDGDGEGVATVGAVVKAKIDIEEEGGDESHEEIDVAEIKVNKHMANVGFSLGRSINMGDFESLKVQVSINVPSEVDEDEIEGNFDFAKGWVEEKMNDIISEYVGDEDDD